MSLEGNLISRAAFQLYVCSPAEIGGKSIQHLRRITLHCNALELGYVAEGQIALIPVSQVFAANTLISNQFELVFAPQGLGAPSSPLVVSLANAGTAQISGFSASITGSNAADFSFTSNCTSLPSTQSCPIQVTFTPQASGVRTASLSVYSTGTPSPVTIALQGVGTGTNSNVLQAVPATVSLSQPIGVTAEVTLSVNYNPPPGVTAALTISSLNVQGTYASDYQLGAAPTTCAPASVNCIVNIYFTPAALGARSASLAITTSSGDLSVPLNGVGIDPTITTSISTGNIEFGGQALNLASVPAPVSVQATGTNPVVISGITLGGSNPGDFSVSNTCSGVTINPVSSSPPSCTFGVTFKPTQAGSRYASLTINDNSVGGPHAIMLSGLGVATGASVLVGNVTQTGANQYGTTDGILPATDFGTVLVSQTSTNANRILNTGSVNVSISEAINGPNATAFQLNPNNDPTDCTAISTLAPNASCTSTIGFTPSAAVSNSAVLSVTDSVSAITQTFILGGIGQAGTKFLAFQTIDGSPTLSQSFGTATVGASVQGFFQFSNTGTEQVTLSGLSFVGGNSADFSLLGYFCPSGGNVLQPGDSCEASVRFKPSGIGYRTAALVVADDAQSGSQSLFLTGAGAPNLTTPYAAAPVNPAAVDFGVNPTGTTTYSSNIRFSNYGNGLVSISQLQMAGPNAADFAVYQNGCQSALTPLQYCDVYVQYTPSVTGAESAYLVLVNNSPYGNVVVALYGVGETATSNGAYVTPTAVNFGPAGQYQTSIASVAISNPGGAPVSVQSATVGGPDSSDFSVGAVSCLATGVSCTVPLNFFSSSDGTEAATLTVVTSVGTATVPLLGNGSAPAPGLRYQPAISISAALGSSAIYNEVFYQIGTHPLSYTVSTPALTGANAADFAVGTLSCNSTNFTCSLPIVFTPSATGSRTATLNLTTSSSTIAIPITGLGQ
jgi:hypothetical protein